MRFHTAPTKLPYLVYASSGIISFLSIWFGLSYFEVVPAFFLPSPHRVLHAIIALTRSGEMPKDILISVTRIVLGTIFSALVALPLGIGLSMSKRFQALFEPLLAFIRYIPPSAFIPLSIIWVGIDETQKILILFLGIAPYLTLLVYDAATNMPSIYHESALTLGATRSAVIKQVVFPYIMPQVWEALRIMVGSAWTYIIIAEIVGATSGLGHLIIESQRFLKTEQIFATIIVIGFLGLITDYLFKWSYQYLFPWTEKSHA